MPTNTSRNIMWSNGYADQDTTFTYELFKSELVAGTAAEGDFDYIRQDD